MELNKLSGIIPANVLSLIPDVVTKFNLTDLRLCHFLAQCYHESAGFKIVQENLNYSADALSKIFGKYFPGQINESYAHIPQKIANRIYANRIGNGDEFSGDGWKYRGRGYIQLTGKSNYTAFGKFINEDCVTNPDLVASKYPLMSAAWFFQTNNIWTTCDKGSGIDTITAVTKRVNGGTIGLNDRIAQFQKIYNALT